MSGESPAVTDQVQGHTTMTDQPNVNKDSPGSAVNTEEDITLTNLSDLINVAPASFTASFVNNINFIYQYNLKDVQDSLELRPFIELSNLRDVLFENFLTLFPAFPAKFLVNRKIAKTVSGDIVQLGYCIVNKHLTKDIDKFTSSVKPAGEKPSSSTLQLNGDIQDLSKLIIMVTDLRKEVNDLKALVTSVQAENERMKKSFQSSNASEGASPVASTSKDLQATVAKVSGDSVQSSETVNSTEAQPSGSDRSREVPNALLPHHRGSPSDPETVSPAESDSSSDSLSDSQLPNMTLVQSRKKKFRKKKQSPSPKSVIKAAAASEQKSSKSKTDISGSTSDVYIGNVDPSILVPDIVSHLHSHNIKVKKEDVHILAKGDIYHSFRVQTPAIYSKKLLESGAKSIWPKGLKIRPFTPKKSSGPVRNQKNHIKPASVHRPNRPNYTATHVSPKRMNYWQRPARHTDGSYSSDWPPLPSRSTRRSYEDYNDAWHRHDYCEYEYDFYCDDRNY